MIDIQIYESMGSLLFKPPQNVKVQKDMTIIARIEKLTTREEISEELGEVSAEKVHGQGHMISIF